MRRHLFLTTLLLVASVATLFAATVSTTVEFGQVVSGQEKSDYAAGKMSNGAVRTLAILSGGVNGTTTLNAADDGYNSTATATKLGQTGNKGKKLETENKSHIRFSALKDEQVRLYYFHASYPTGKDQSTFVNNNFYLSHTSGTSNIEDDKVLGIAGSSLALKQIYYVDFTIPEDGTFYISVYDGSTSVNVSGIKFTYEEAGTVIAKAALTAKDAYEASGWYVDPTQKTVKATEFNTSSVDITATYDGKKGYRLNGTGNYVGVAVNGTTFQEGDVLNVFVTKVPSQGTLAVYADNAGTEPIYDTESVGVLGNNRITLPAAANGKTVLYVARTASNTWNGNIYSVEVSRADIPYQMLFGYTWTSTALSEPVSTAFDLTNYGVLRAGTAATATNGATGALVRTVTDGVNMLSLNNRDNYIEVTAADNLQAGDEISIMAYAGGASERGFCIEPTSVVEYKTSNTTTLKTTTYNARELHHIYTAEFTEEWLTANGVTNTIRIFRDNAGGSGVEKIDIVRHQKELKAQEVTGGTINGVATDMTADRIEKLNTASHSFSMSGAYHATIVLNVQQTYMLDGDPANTRVINKEITLTEGEIAADGSTPYTATVGDITYKIVLKPYTASIVDGNKTWSWANLPNTTEEMKNEGTVPARGQEFVMATVTGKYLNFNAQNLTIAGQFAVTEKNNGGSSEKVKCFVGNIIKFTTTVPGIVRATWVANGTTERVLTINGIATTVSSSATTDEYITTEDIYVPAGEVVIQCALTNGNSSKQYFRLTELKFQATEAATVRSGLTAGKFGTICLSKDAYNAIGATFYNLEYTDGSSVTLIEHTGVLKAGMPYVFEAEETEITVAYKNMTAVTEAKHNNGLYGTLTPMEAGLLTGNYFISNNEIRLCGEGATLGANRAYIKLGEVSRQSLEAPGRRCTLGVPKVATAMENAEAETVARKVLKDGQVLIIRQGCTYTPDGRIF